MSRFEFLADDKAEAISGGFLGSWGGLLGGGYLPTPAPYQPEPPASTTNSLAFTKTIATTDVKTIQKNSNNSQAALLGFVKASQHNNSSVMIANSALA